jgi:hypothetical protein
MEHLESYQMANNNKYRFFYLISKIEPLRLLCQSFNKLENKRLSGSNSTIRTHCILFFYEEKKI